MLSPQPQVLEHAIAAFTAAGVEAAYCVPTRTGLDHKLLDATAQIREFLGATDTHRFEEQAVGVEHKRVLPITMLTAGAEQESTISLYRPATKEGRFTRMWIPGLPDFSGPGDVLAFVVGPDGSLHVVNCSEPGLLESMSDPRSPLGRLIAHIQGTGAGPELRSLLCGIAARGFVPTMRDGDTGVGFTLETLLGIKANSSRHPDYKGIEIKSGRVKATSTPKTYKKANKTTLFSKTPDWKRCGAKRNELIPTYGYFDPKEDRMALYCTVGPTPNSQSLFLLVNEAGDQIEVRHGSPTGDSHQVMVWDLAVLEASLRQKHHETFWVHAVTRTNGDGVEEFHYVTAEHTQAALAGNLGPLIAAGKVTLDLVMHIEPNGRVRDHGFLWRMEAGDLPLLFPGSRFYDLGGGAA